MPVYDFESPDGKVISVLVPLNAADAERASQTVDGVVYKRVYSAPLAAKDTLRKGGSNEDFKRVTEGKNLKVGEMWEISKEMSKDRADRNGGHDPVKEQYYRDYAKKTGGPHADVKAREAAEKRRKLMNEMGIKVD